MSLIGELLFGGHFKKHYDENGKVVTQDDGWVYDKDGKLFRVDVYNDKEYDEYIEVDKDGNELRRGSKRLDRDNDRLDSYRGI